MWPRRITAGVMLLAWLAASCGSSATTTSMAQPDLSEQEAPSPDLAPPAPELSDLTSNPNDTTSPMGALCWARWEIARAQLLVIVKPSDASETVVEAMARVAEADLVRTMALSSELPEAVRVFATSLFDQIDDRTDATGDASPIDFDALDGASAYVEEAAKAPGCQQP